MCQSNYFQNECCSITSRRAVMCALNLVKVQCVSVKLLSMLLVTFFAFWHFADGPLGLVSQTPAYRDQRILYRAEESLFWGNLACSSFSTPLEKKRGVICVLKTICSRVIDPEKSNLSISCQLYRTLTCTRTRAHWKLFVCTCHCFQTDKVKQDKMNLDKLYIILKV